jgi:DNA-binding NarL/FixJ family response regulator
MGMTDQLDDGCGAHKIRVLICDDHDLIRQALRGVINAEPDMQVIGEASDGEQAVAMVGDLRPDAIVMDIEMPRLSGIEATRRIKSIAPDAIILVLTVHDSNEYVLRILEAGATAYLTKGIISKDIPNAIRAAMNGESILSEEILKKLLSYALQFPPTNGLRRSDNCLSEREAEIIRLASEGCGNKVIATRLNLSENTVKKYMMSIFDKLGVHSRTAAVIAAQQSGLLAQST